MKILNICVRIDSKSGGGSVAAIELARVFSSAGFDVDNWIVVDTSDGVLLDVTDLRTEFFNSTFGSHRFRYSKKIARAMRNRLNQYDLVLISGLYLFPNTYAAYLCRKFNIPYILLPYDSFNIEKMGHSWLQKKIYRWLFDNRLIKGAKLIQAANDTEKAQIVSYTGQDTNVFIASYGFNIDQFRHPQPIELFQEIIPWIASEHRTILYLARVAKTKGVETLIEAYKKIIQMAPDFRLLIVGPAWDVTYNQELNQKYNDLIKDQKIYFAGMVDEPIKYACFQNSYIYVLPSYAENFGITVLESIANKLVSVVTDRVPWEDLVDFNCGYRVKSKDVDALCKAILEYSNLSESEREEMKERAYELANNYGYDEISHLYSSAFYSAGRLSKD